MKDKMCLIVTCTPEEAKKASAKGLPYALASYGIWQGHLYHNELPESRFAVMAIDGTRYSGEGSHRVLSFEIIREAIARGCRGIILDLAAPSPQLKNFCASVAASCEANGIDLYLSEKFAAETETARALIRTALCVGSLKNRLSAACKTFSPSRVVPDIELLRVEFRLPSPSGAGRFMDAEELYRVKCSCPVFYCHELTANYMVRFDGDNAYFIIFDDKRTLSSKLITAKTLGIKTAFMRFGDLKFFE